MILLKRGREKSVKRRHPWIFSGAIEKISGKPQRGETVEVRSASGEVLARAAYSPQSQIRARVWTFNAAQEVDAAFLRSRIMDALAELTGCAAIYERSDAETRKLEGLEARAGFVRGNREASRCPIIEYGLNFKVDVEQGQKTGFFLDQRENRQQVRALATGREVLDGFCYTGGFAINALAGGAARVTAVESSAPSLEVARENLAANALDGSKVEFVHADAFSHLRTLRDRGAHFDLVVLDPPKFAPTAAQAKNAARAYKDINLLALKLLRPGGLLATFSCSGGVDAALFQSIVAGAALDAGVEAKIIERYSAAADHPVALQFPEGEYLKGLLVLRT